MVKDLPANAGDTGGINSILDWKVSLEEEISTHFSTLAWEMARTEEPGQLQYMGLQTVRHDQVAEHALSFQHVINIRTINEIFYCFH